MYTIGIHPYTDPLLSLFFFCLSHYTCWTNRHQQIVTYRIVFYLGPTQAGLGSKNFRNKIFSLKNKDYHVKNKFYKIWTQFSVKNYDFHVKNNFYKIRTLKKRTNLRNKDTIRPLQPSNLHNFWKLIACGIGKSLERTKNWNFYYFNTKIIIF